MGANAPRSLPTLQVNTFFQAQAPPQIFFEYRQGPALDALPAGSLLSPDIHGTRRLSAIRARRGNMGGRRCSGLGMTAAAPKNAGEDGVSSDGEHESLAAGPDPALDRAGKDCGHLFVTFGEGLSTKSPVIFFAKTKGPAHDGKVAVDLHKASFALWCLSHNSNGLIHTRPLRCRGELDRSSVVT